MENHLDKLARTCGIERWLIPLKEGESCPAYAIDDPPEGYRFETDDELRQRIMASVNYASRTTEHSFLEKMRKVDPMCKVDFNIEVPMAIRIHPSSAVYRETLRQQADLERPVGLVVSITREVDDWGFPETVPWWRRLWYWLFGARSEED